MNKLSESQYNDLISIAHATGSQIFGCSNDVSDFDYVLTSKEFEKLKIDIEDDYDKDYDKDSDGFEFYNYKCLSPNGDVDYDKDGNMIFKNTREVKWYNE